MPSSKNILVVGLGSIAKKHIDALYKINPNYTIYALRSDRQSKPYTTSNGLEVQNLYNLEDIAEIDLDFAMITNPTSAHYSTINSLSCFNIPLFIEKPLFDTIQNERDSQLIKNLEKRNILTYVAYVLRFHPGIQFLKELVSEGELKKIEEVTVYSGSYLPDWRPNQDFRKSYSADSKLGGGVHLDLSHEIDYILWLFGKPESKYSVVGNSSSLKISAVDSATYLLRYSDFQVSVQLNYYRKIKQRFIEIVCEDHIWKLDFIENKLYKDNLVIKTYTFSFEELYKSQLEYFIGLIKNNLSGMNSISESYEILKIVL